MGMMAVLSPKRLKLKLLLAIIFALVCFYICTWLVTDQYNALAKYTSEIHMNRFLGGPEDEDEEEEDREILQHLERNWKEPEWEVADILRHGSSAKKPKLPVFVVEEHHEVLKYWFDAVETGLLPKKGNTLVHIDGHADNAPPRDPWRVPWFHLPRNHSEVANMMQTNDAFIAGAALTGLISRYIWIWPEWDKSEHNNLHEVSDIKAGWRTYYPPNGKPFRRICACERERFYVTLPTKEDPMPKKKVLRDSEWHCWDDTPDDSLMSGGAVVQSIECKAFLTGIQEVIHERRAVELLKEGGWIRNDEKLMLDIDEDYYGCESSIMPLLNAGMKQNDVEMFSAIVGNTLCVNEVKYELAADKFFENIVRIVEEFRSRDCNHDTTQKCIPTGETDIALLKLIPSLQASFKQAGLEDQVCDLESTKLTLQAFMRSVYDLNKTETEALKYVGFCLRTAPSSFTFEPNSLHVCHGFNVPGDMSVIVHVPNAEENKMRTAILRNTLSLLPSKPLLVTVCRSMRDGYTPWAFFDRIEEAVIETLKSVYSDIHENSFHFDENLLGGKQGWPSRKR